MYYVYITQTVTYFTSAQPSEHESGGIFFCLFLLHVTGEIPDELVNICPSNKEMLVRVASFNFITVFITVMKLETTFLK